MKARITKKKKPAHHKPELETYETSDGTLVYVGKNNKQNDMLTVRTAKKNDLWFHVQKMPGSHVIVKAENRQVPENTLLEAALLAAYYSKGKYSTNVAVDYTERKNVKKPKDAKAGMVIYENFKTIFVTPAKEKIDKLKMVEE